MNSDGGKMGAKAPPGATAYPGQPVCRMCETPLTPQQAVKGICDSMKCEMQRVQSAARGVFQRNWQTYVGRQRDAVETVGREIAAAAARLGAEPDEIAVGVVPRQERPVVELPEERLQAFSAHLDEIIEKSFAEGEPEADLETREKEESPELPLIDATCATCQGKCCILGGPAHGFLNLKNIHQFRLRNPGATPASIKEYYLGKLPDVSVEHSCVFHGPVGCVLDRTERGDVCNRYHCNPQTQLLLRYREMEASKAVIVATEDHVEPVVATYTEEDGWLPPRSEEDLADFKATGRDQQFIDAAVESALNHLPPGTPGGTGV
ncbi:MAG: hypothetical protein AAF479_08230 [Pseudomonadota bacterium]